MLKEKYLAFSGGGNPRLARDILAALNRYAGWSEVQHVKLSHLDYTIFADGETFVAPANGEQEKIAGRHILLFQSGKDEGYFNEIKSLIRFCKLKKIATKITLMYFFMHGRRQDHGSRFVNKPDTIDQHIDELKLAGLDNLILIDAHAAKYVRDACQRNNILYANIDPGPVYAEYLKPYVQVAGVDNFFVYSPDYGSAARAVSTAKVLGVKVIVTPKIRTDSGIEVVENADLMQKLSSDFPGSTDYFVPFSDDLVRGKWLAMREDELARGSTAAESGKKLRKKEVGKLFFWATHAVCAPGWKGILGLYNGNNPFDRIYLANTLIREYPDQTGGVVTGVDLGDFLGRNLFAFLLGLETNKGIII